jgi:hypothetical protein
LFEFITEKKAKGMPERETLKNNGAEKKLLCFFQEICPEAGQISESGGDGRLTELRP